MPGFNKTGPQGMGPMTGRGMGSCGGGQVGVNRGFGRGLGYGRGRMLRVGSNYQPTKSDLENEKNYLKQELEAVNEELKKK